MFKYVAIAVALALCFAAVNAEEREPEMRDLTDDVVNDLLEDAIKRVADDIACRAQGGEYMGRNYYFETAQRRNHGESSDFCKTMGMNLVAVNDCRENTFITRFIKAMRCEHENFWTSGFQNGDKNWYWASTGAAISFNNWKVGEPNYGKDAYCVHIRKDYLQWNDEKCSDKYYAVCSTK